MTHKATCQTCKTFATFSSRRVIASEDLPPFLALNASVYSDENLELWLDSRNQRFLPPKVEIRGQTGEDFDAMSATYEVRSLVVKITTKDRSHLVSLVKGACMIS
jgi:hypothetical protein